jgi:2-polyprenyl-3-methyl-5-hydroxy-6-metoxy-1,4-benzoquinol methylase
VEELDKYDIQPDIFLCFETLEHLTDPCRFLYQLSTKTKARFLIVTVPYLKESRIGLHNIRSNRTSKICAENTHIFELSPQDWKLLMMHSGWSVLKEKIYFQYPLKGILKITKRYWKKYDFEGFYGVILARDYSWSSLYSDW